MDKWVELNTYLHEMLGDSIDNCFIVNCKRKAIVKVKGKDSHNIYFVCLDCAFELVETKTHFLVK